MFRKADLLLTAILFAGLAVAPAAFVMPKFGGPHDPQKAELKYARKQMAVIQYELGKFRLDTGRYPSTAEGLKALATMPAGLERKWRGPYFDTPITLDPFGHAYQYISNTAHFTLTSFGADGMKGGRARVRIWS